MTAEIDANDDPTVIDGFTTDYAVSVRDGLGNKVSGPTVTVSNPSLGKITLADTAVGSGDLAKSGRTFPGGCAYRCARLSPSSYSNAHKRGA